MFVQLGLIIHVRPPTSDSHNFFVRTLFQALLDSMESSLSQNSSHVLWRIVGEHNLAEIYVWNRVCMLLGCVDVNSRVLT